MEIVLDGKTYELCPSYESLSRIEEALDKGSIAIARHLANGDIRLEELLVIIQQCCKVQDVPAHTLQHAMINGQLANIVTVIGEMYANILDRSDAVGTNRDALNLLIERFPDAME